METVEVVEECVGSGFAEVQGGQEEAIIMSQTEDEDGKDKE